MFRSKNFLPDPKRFLVEWLGFGVLAHILVQRGQVIKAKCCVGIFRPKNVLPDPERFLVEWLGFGVVPDLLENEPEVIQGIGGLGVIRALQCALPLQPLFPRWESPPDIFPVQSVGLVVDAVCLDHRLRPKIPGMLESRGQVLTAQTVILPAIDP